MEVLYILGYVFFAILLGGILNSIIKVLMSYYHNFGKHEKSNGFKLHHEQ